MAAPIYIPISGAPGFPFPTPSLSLISFLLDGSHPYRCEVIAHCGLICISLMVSDAERLFTYLLVTTWMDFEGIMLSEVSQRKTNTAWYHVYVESKKKKGIPWWRSG